MRQVRRRTHEYAYSEVRSAAGGGASTTRTSPVWSNVGGPTTPGTPGAGAGAGWGQDHAGGQGQGQGQAYYSPGANRSNSYVNYSKYDEGQYYDQSPYGYEQQYPQRQQQQQQQQGTSTVDVSSKR